VNELPPEKIVRLLVTAEKRSHAAVQRATRAIAAVAAAVERALRAGGRLFYLGAGTSGRLGALDAAECPPTFGTRPSQVQAIVAGGARALRRSVEGAEDRAADAARAIRTKRISARDVVVGITASGTTPFVLGGLAEARRRGATTALVTCAASSPAPDADLLVRLVVGPEVLRGSTRLKAGTATKMALNAISTCALARLGRTHGPYMVDVVASNAKLRARARGLLRELGEVPESDLDRLLAAAGGQVKLAIAMARLGVERREAERRLDEAGGSLRDALSASRRGPRARARAPRAPRSSP
jgi:N-acetylmuramic acid 6-phosphate etherase